MIRKRGRMKTLWLNLDPLGRRLRSSSVIIFSLLNAVCDVFLCVGLKQKRPIFVLSSVSFLLQFDKYPTKVDPFYRHSVSFSTAY